MNRLDLIARLPYTLEPLQPGELWPASFDILEHDKVLQSWAYAKDYAEMLSLNRRYLRCESKSTPYCASEIYAETVPLVPSLIRLHDYGIMTIMSQPRGRDPLKQETHDNWEPATQWVQYQKRPYLSFVIPTKETLISTETVNSFCKALMNHPGIFTTIWESKSQTRQPFQDNMSPVLDNTSDSMYYWLQHTGPVMEKLEPHSLRRPISTNTAISGGAKSWGPLALRKLEPIDIRVIAKDWEEEDLMRLVEDMAIAVGMRRVFFEDAEGADNNRDAESAYR